MESKGKRPAFHIAWGQKSIVSLHTKQYTPSSAYMKSREGHTLDMIVSDLLANSKNEMQLIFICRFFFFCCFFCTLAKELTKIWQRRMSTTQGGMKISLNSYLTSVSSIQRRYVHLTSHQMLIEISVLDSPHIWESVWRSGRIQLSAGNCFNSFIFHQGQIFWKNKTTTTTITIKTAQRSVALFWSFI